MKKIRNQKLSLKNAPALVRRSLTFLLFCFLGIQSSFAQGYDMNFSDFAVNGFELPCTAGDPNAVQCVVVNGTSSCTPNGLVSDIPEERWRILDSSTEYSFEFAYVVGGQASIPPGPYYVSVSYQYNSDGQSYSEILYEDANAPDFNTISNISFTTPPTASDDGILIFQFAKPGVFADELLIPFMVTGPLTLADVPIEGTVVTPQIPYLVLHDPPGDASFSQFQEATKICRTSSTTYNESFGGGFTASAKIGLAGTAGIIVTQDFEFSVEFTTQFKMSQTDMNSEEVEECVETINGFSTSSLPGITGEEADIFVGYGQTLFWGTYDVMTFDGCVKDTVKRLAYAADPNGTTTFIRTASDIQADIALQMSIADNPANSTLARDRAYNQVEVWQEVLALNAANVANASESMGNYNFSGGGQAATFDESITTSEITTISYDVAIESNSSINTVVEVGATGFSGGPEFTFSNNKGSSTANSTSNSEIIHYELQDDDAGDIFNTQAFRDPTYGTPIFRLNLGSKSSCPYEGGIQRDQARINFAGFACSGGDVKILDVVDNQDFSSPTMVSIDLCNDSNESRTYQLSTNGTNLNGLSGLVEDDYTVAANACLTLNLFLTGNGTANDSHSIDFLLYPYCEGSTEQDEADLASLDISFEAGATYQANPACVNDRLYVDKSATGMSDGTTWNNAYNHLQDAIAAAVSGDTICVAGGTYYPDEGANQTNNDQNASFLLKNGVVILGGFAGTESYDFDVNQRDIAANETILSGDISQTPSSYLDNTYQVVYNTNVDNTAVLDGFTITQGAARFSPTNENGAGIYNDNASPVIKNCFIHRNSASVGGGMYLANNSNPMITNCNFMINYADIAGGAIAIAGSVPTISYCSFSGNWGNINGPAVRVFSSGGVNISRSILWGNGQGSGGTNVDILYSAGSGTCDYCIIDADGGGTYPGVGGLNQNPLFVDQAPLDFNYVGGDLRLQAGSPAIDFLTDPSGPMLDQDGKMRPIGTGYDIGAYEFGLDCPSSFNLTGTLNSATDYETSGILQSTQIISSTINVQYDSGSCIELNSGFEVQLGAQFDAFIDGCGNVLQAEIEQQ